MDSGIILGIHASSPYFVEATQQNAALLQPADPSLCGKIWGIVYVDVANQNQDTDAEMNKNNNFGVDEITLICHQDGMFEMC